MRLLSFNLFRTLHLPGVTYIKPEHWQRHHADIKLTDWVLFPEYWQINTLVYGFKKRIFPSVSTYHLGHDKVQMTRVFEALYPAHVPHTRILAADDDKLAEVPEEFGFPFVAKEVRNSMGQGVFFIETPAQWRTYTQANAVWYVQEYLPIERDLRVVVIGNQVLSAYWREMPPGGFHANIARGGKLRFDGIPPAAVAFAARVAAELGIDHAGFDIALVDGHPYLLEFNLYFGNQGLTAQGLKPVDAIHAYLANHPDSPRPPVDNFPVQPMAA